MYILPSFFMLRIKPCTLMSHLAYLRIAWGIDNRATILEQIWLGSNERLVTAPPLTSSRKHGKWAYTTAWCSGQPGTQVQICSKGSGSAPYCNRS